MPPAFTERSIRCSAYSPPSGGDYGLTILATIFLPLTFVTGFFGQNFGWLTGHITTLTAFGIYGIGALLVSLAVLLSWLRRRRADTDTITAARNNLQPRPAPGPRAAVDHPSST